ncbi:hypothetical protein AB6A40_006604 [Gnathostoma spinigerum]|uniref:Uncharacterized protein n=1 Tax=Gnathostoma spinigerum TaxID=75299 RepID=A0ABD6EIU2_9BILA
MLECLSFIVNGQLTIIQSILTPIKRSSLDVHRYQVTLEDFRLNARMHFIRIFKAVTLWDIIECARETILDEQEE